MASLLNLRQYDPQEYAAAYGPARKPNSRSGSILQALGRALGANSYWNATRNTLGNLGDAASSLGNWAAPYANQAYSLYQQGLNQTPRRTGPLRPNGYWGGGTQESTMGAWPINPGRNRWPGPMPGQAESYGVIGRAMRDYPDMMQGAMGQIGNVLQGNADRISANRTGQMNYALANRQLDLRQQEAEAARRLAAERAADERRGQEADIEDRRMAGAQATVVDPLKAGVSALQLSRLLGPGPGLQPKSYHGDAIQAWQYEKANYEKTKDALWRMLQNSANVGAARPGLEDAQWQQENALGNTAAQQQNARYLQGTQQQASEYQNAMRRRKMLDDYTQEMLRNFNTRPRQPQGPRSPEEERAIWALLAQLGG